MRFTGSSWVGAIPSTFHGEADLIADELDDRFEFSSSPLEKWIDRWDWLARSALSYPAVADDAADAYVVGLFARAWLAEAMKIASTDFSWWLVQTVDVIDETFLANTDLDHDDLLWGETRNPSWWWLRRIPRDVALAESIRSLSSSKKRGYEIRVLQSACAALNSGEHLEVYQIDSDVWRRVADRDSKLHMWFQSERPEPVAGLLDGLLDDLADAAAGETLHDGLSVEGWSSWRWSPAPIRAVALNPMRKSRRPEQITLDELKKSFIPIDTNSDWHQVRPAPSNRWWTT